jgi:hypothetical protein
LAACCDAQEYPFRTRHECRTDRITVDDQGFVVLLIRAVSMTVPARSNSVPKMMLPVYQKIVGLTDDVCDKHLNSEYRDLARAMTRVLWAADCWRFSAFAGTSLDKARRIFGRVTERSDA